MVVQTKRGPVESQHARGLTMQRSQGQGRQPRVPKGAPWARGRAALHSSWVMVRAWHRTSGRGGCQPCFALFALPSLACLWVRRRATPHRMLGDLTVRGRATPMDTPCPSPSREAVILTPLARPHPPSSMLSHGRHTGTANERRKIWTRLGAVWLTKSGQGLHLPWDSLPRGDGLPGMRPSEQDRREGAPPEVSHALSRALPPPQTGGSLPSAWRREKGEDTTPASLISI